MAENDSEAAKRPKRVPCTNCRQQKAKCDAEPGYGKPCSRCAKLGNACVVSTDFKREMKRRRGDDSSSTAVITTVSHRSSTGIPTPVTSYDEKASGDGPTLPRTLDKVTLDALRIDSLFDTFFQRYHPFLPILDSNILPNAVFSRCPLTFFAIVAVAAQKNDPSLSATLAPSIYSLALTAPRYKANYYNSIHAILLILTWPLDRLPDNDATFPLSASVMHMALTIGLHVPISTIEFQRLGQTLTEADIVQRAKLWAQVQVAYARVCIWKGLTAFSLSQRVNDNVLSEKVPPELRFHRRIQHTVLKFFEAATEIGLRRITPEQDRALRVLINVYDDQLKIAADEQSGENERLAVAMARLQVLLFHFFRAPENQPQQDQAMIYSLSTGIVTAAQRMDTTHALLSVAPFYIAVGVLISSHTLMRLCKTMTEPWFDHVEAEKFLHESIDILRRMSKDPNDIPNRCAHRIMQLWPSKRVFRKPDGSIDYDLRAKNRFSLSVVLDIMWRWRDEFEQPEAEAAPGNHSHPQNAVSGSESEQSVDMNGMPPNDPSTWIDDQFLFDFGLDVDLSQEWMPPQNFDLNAVSFAR